MRKYLSMRPHPPITRQRPRARSRSALITIDLRGLRFSLELLFVAGVIAGGAYAALPFARYALDLEPGHQTASALGAQEERATDTMAAEWAIESIATSTTIDASTSDDDFIALLGAVPTSGKFVRVDSEAMRVSLYEDGVSVAQFPITQVPEVASADEVAEGLYSVLDKQAVKLSTLTLVRFPHYVRFNDRFAVHGEPTDADGAVRTESPMEGSIILADADAKKVYSFVTTATPLFVHTGRVVQKTADTSPIAVEEDGALPATSADSYFIADLESGQVYLEKGSDSMFPVASITKFVTAAVASSLIPHTDEVLAPNGESYTVGDLYYLLLLRSDNGVADALAEHVGIEPFVANMNTFVQSVGMQHTSFADPSGLSPRNISTTRDLALLAKHLYDKKQFILDISSEESMTITSSGGMRLGLENQNKLAADPHFRGGKLGFTDEAGQTSLAIFSVPVDGKVRPVVVSILGSKDWKQDTRTLLRWLLQNTKAIEQ